MIDNKIRVGILGYSEGNGHPYSFSSIINGFNSESYDKSDWAVIKQYLIRQDEIDFEDWGAEVTHVWCPSYEVAKNIALCSKIANPILNYEDMSDEVDAVIIARDDWETHFSLAFFFLEKGKFVFVDKPLTQSLHELKKLLPYLMSGQLMSFSGFRFATELDVLRANEPIILEKGEMIEAHITNDWSRYGIHMIDASLGCIANEPDTIYSDKTSGSVTVVLDTGAVIRISCMGPDLPVSRFCLFSKARTYSVELKDNYGAFRRGLKRFLGGLPEGAKMKQGELTMKSILLLIAGQEALEKSGSLEYSLLKNKLTQVSK